VNQTVTTICLAINAIGAEGAVVLADALKVNSSLTKSSLCINDIGDEGASALANALKVNTSVTSIELSYNGIDATSCARVNTLTARNRRLRRLFLFDLRQILLSVMCADERGVVWPYLLERGDTDGIVTADAAELIRLSSLKVTLWRCVAVACKVH
jgi:hypothetical protein